MKHLYAYLILAALFSSPAMQGQNNSNVLNGNNAHALFFANGRTSQTLDAQPYYFVPATLNDDGPSPLFSASLWIGGSDSANELHFAGERFEQIGLDFFPGPLGTNASITESTSMQYNIVRKVQRIDVERQTGYFNCLADPNCDAATEYPGYTVPQSFLDWPAHGDVGLGQAFDLADFYDYDLDGQYDPTMGDSPCFPGDQALFTIYNDNLAPHTESGGTPIGVEIHMTPFAYVGNGPVVNQTIFVRYKIIDRGSIALHDVYIGLFDDFDLGCASDDYIQCDVGRNLFFVLNGDDIDEDCNGSPGYGTPSPAFGVVVLKGPLMDADGSDNTDMTTPEGYNGTGFNDGVVDNERLGMGRFGYFENTGGPTGDPTIAEAYYRKLQGQWTDGTPLTYGGSGYTLDPDSTPARFAFPGNSDPLGIGTGGIPMPAWTQASAGFQPTDQRGIASVGPFTLLPGEEQEIVIAYVFARPTGTGLEARIEALNNATDSVRAFAQTIPGLLGPGFDCAQLPTAITSHVATDHALRLFPNPGDDQLNIETHAKGMIVVEISDGMGRVVLSTSSPAGKATIGTSSLASGLYQVKVTTSRGGHTSKWAKR